MNSLDNNATLLRWGVIAVVVVVLGGMTFLAGFGAGFGTGRMTAPHVASLEPASQERTRVGPDSASIAGSSHSSGGLPEEFDLIWEAWAALEEDFYGDLPDTPEFVGGLVTGVLRASERELDETLDREKTMDALLAAALASVEAQTGLSADSTRLTYGAINGLTNVLDDDYTFLRDPEAAEFFNEGLNGSFEGIGARVDLAEGGGVRIVEPFEEQPAWKAGLRRDDVILAVDSVDITDMTLTEAISLIRGPKGTSVNLLVKSSGQDAREVEVVRDRISIPVVEYELLDNDIAYLRLGEFSAPATRQLRDALEELQDQGAQGLILDLRGNPGGFLRTAVDISSEFIREGPILVERFKDGEEQIYEASGRGKALDIPVVVLVNEGSASASEILAGAIQDSGRGALIGVTTFGKGSVQVPHELTDGSVLSVTTARWYTPLDRQINGKGLLPDIEVDRTSEDREAGRDPQLDRAIEYLLSAQQSDQQP